MSALTFQAMRALLHADRQHLVQRLDVHGARPRGFLVLYPPYLSVCLFRLSQLCASRRYGLLARLVQQLNLMLTGADLDGHAAIGGGLVILSPAAVSLTGRAGRNLVMGAVTGLGTEMSADDVGGGPGRPVLGDDVELAAHSGVLGPVRIGHRVRIGPGCAVTRDVPDDTNVEPHAARFLSASTPR